MASMETDRSATIAATAAQVRAGQTRCTSNRRRVDHVIDEAVTLDWLVQIRSE
jgi:hypothetical protein